MIYYILMTGFVLIVLYAMWELSRVSVMDIFNKVESTTGIPGIDESKFRTYPGKYWHVIPNFDPTTISKSETHIQDSKNYICNPGCETSNVKVKRYVENDLKDALNLYSKEVVSEKEADEYIAIEMYKLLTPNKGKLFCKTNSSNDGFFNC